MDGEITVDNIIMIFMDAECFKKIKFRYRVGFENNFSRVNIKSMEIFPAMFSNGGFAGFIISNAGFMII